MRTSELILLAMLLIAVACQDGENPKRNPENIVDDKDEQKEIKYPKTNLNDELALFPEVKAILEQNSCIKNKSCSTQVIEAGNAQLK